MYKHILIATDGSELGDLSVDHGIALAASDKARVTIVNVTEPWSAVDLAFEAHKHTPNPIQQFETIATAYAQKTLDAASDKARKAGLSVDTVHVPNRHAAEGVVATADDKGCDLIVMASHGRRGVGRLILGSQAYEVLTHTKIPTLIVR
jgi:nucleotide-binding universal stress UspA family protein